ncbi:hypothetical protein [Bradyrhizobium sp. CCBAU 21362]|uniref:hypothetical protein n=1 Tax=Bradyrhizobium sp. CCBAU 21362 TaxID=1325082 RepID=UPI003FA43E43
MHPNLPTVWRRQARTGVFGPVPALRQEDELQFAAVSVAPEPPLAWDGSCVSVIWRPRTEG